jgi:membrane protein DedA with SNARE-associated domain
VIVTAAGAAMAGRMIGYVIGHKFGSWLLFRYGHYVGLTAGRIKLGQYLFLRYGGKIVFFSATGRQPDHATVACSGFRFA